MTAKRSRQDELIFGHGDSAHLVAADFAPGDEADHIVLYFRSGDETEKREVHFRPWMWLTDTALLKGFDDQIEVTELSGNGPLRHRAILATWKDALQALKQVKKNAGKNATAPDAPFLFINDPVQQYLMESGETLFKGMVFSDLRRMQIDIETYTAPGYDFCNANRDTDRITAIAMADTSGWVDVLNGAEMSEKQLLEEMVQRVRERDPDAIEGHNFFNFDLPYLMTRAKKHKVKLALGRDGSPPKVRSSRFSAGERTINFLRADLHGRHIIDTFFLVQLYDITSRALESFGLKNVAIHFGIAAPGRTYLDGSTLSQVFDNDSDQLMDYARDDILETRDLAAILSPVYFAQSQILPFSYQNICIRGNATKIDALMLRRYLHEGHALPFPQPRRNFAGGYTDMFRQGLINNVHHCDVRSLYPSLMLNDHLAPASDEMGIFLELLDYLRNLRFRYKDRKSNARSDDRRIYYDALQSSLKILINSFYGYLGFSQARFNDFHAAEEITQRGRDLLKQMIDTIRKLGGDPIEIDTDGIYFQPPEKGDDQTFREAFRKELPEGIEVEFDGEYQSMFSYKMKNYALLEKSGEVIIKGAALKSRGLEPFQRRYLKEYLRLKLENRDTDIPALQNKYESAIRNREWPIRRLAKSETLQADPETYAAKVKAGGRSRNAAYELALASKRKYRAGDQVAYYVTGDKKSVTVYSAAKLVSDWNPENRDENIPYYLEKLHKLFKNFGDEARQQTLF